MRPARPVPVVDVPPGPAGPQPGGWFGRYDSDLGGIVLLLFLYTLQGVPMGLAASVPLILQERNISYAEQAMLSLVSWPFSLKLLWAPLVDAVYSRRIGRRKSWLLPIQLAMAAVLVYGATHIPRLIGDDESHSRPDVWSLTLLFGALYALAATQDIAVDGWALTILSRKNVGMASTCNTIGQMAGYLAAFVVFLAFNSPDFCNRWVRAVPEPRGMLSLGDFMAWWGYVFAISTLIVGFLKAEASELDAEEDTLTLKEAYLQMWRLCQLRPYMRLIALMLTSKIGFAAADAITTLKLIEKGVPKETMGALAIALTPLNILGTAYISHHSSGPRPLTLLMKSYPPRLVMGLCFVGLVWLAPTDAHTVSWGFFTLVAVLTCIHQLASTFMFVAQISFFARISDPAIGGTCMTLLNTVTNLGYKWPQTIVLGLVDYTSFRTCYGPAGEALMSCARAAEVATCKEAGGVCHTHLDGFTILSVVCTVIGTGWVYLFQRKMLALQELDEEEWMLRSTKRRQL